MNYLPSPPSSPLLSSTTIPSTTEEKVVICGSCDQVLGPDWFCSTCHTKCTICNRFLTEQEYCTRCWIYDHTHQTMIRRRPLPSIPYFMMIPTPTTSSSSVKSNQSYYF